MNKRAEELAIEYADKKLQAVAPELWEIGYTRYRKMSVQVMDGSDVEEAYQDGYEQAEKDTIELAQLWVDSGDANVMSFKQFLKKKSEEEQ